MTQIMTVLAILIASYAPAPPPELSYQPEVIADPIASYAPVAAIQPLEPLKQAEVGELALELPPPPPEPVYAPQVRVYGGANDYDYGYCTWYVKNRRPDLPSSMGNANAWLNSARAHGMAIGYSPRAGAVGVSTGGAYGHVVYVESVNGDDTINISEMNYQGWGVQSSRTTSASEFDGYIY